MTTPSPLADLLAIELDDRVKGLPPGVSPFPLGAIGKRGWRILDGDLPLPVALLKDSTLPTMATGCGAFSPPAAPSSRRTARRR